MGDLRPSQNATSPSGVQSRFLAPRNRPDVVVNHVIGNVDRKYGDEKESKKKVSYSVTIYKRKHMT